MPPVAIPRQIGPDLSDYRANVPRPLTQRGATGPGFRSGDPTWSPRFPTAGPDSENDRRAIASTTRVVDLEKGDHAGSPVRRPRTPLPQQVPKTKRPRAFARDHLFSMRLMA